MTIQKAHVIGIVGGMGPQAGVALFNNILSHTRADSDQQHLSVILMSLPKDIADRTAFLDGRENQNPAYSIVKIIEKLECVGATVVGLACNTSYAPEIYDTITNELNRINSKVTLLHMPVETCNYIKKNFEAVRRVGLMTTNGSYKAGLYKNILAAYGYQVVVPDDQFQNDVIHKMIYHPKFGIKANVNCVTKEVRILMQEALSFFKDNRADAIILGCTELPLVVKMKTIDNMIIVDSSDVLAQALIREATSFRKMSDRYAFVTKSEA